MRRLTVFAVVLALTTTACDGDESPETVPVVEERRTTIEELRREHIELHERIRELPPEEQEQLRQEMHRDMWGDTLPPMPHHPPGARPGRPPQPRPGMPPSPQPPPAEAPDTSPAPDTVPNR